MTTEILSSEITKENTPQKLSLATQKQLYGVISEITGVLSLEAQQEIQEKNEKMKTLLEQLQQEIQKRSEEIGYDYEARNYEKRLCQNDEFLEKVFQERVLGNGNNIFGKLFKRENKIQKIYEEMIEMAPEKSRKTMKEKLKREYFEDLIYESLEYTGLKAWESLNLRCNNLWKKSGEELEEIMKSLPVGLKHLNLGGNNLWHKSGEELEKMMKSLPVGLKHLNLGYNNLGNKSGEELEKMMKSLLVGLKSLNLRDNNLGDKSREEFEKIMKSLPLGLKHLDLKYNNISDQTQEELQQQFPNINIIF